MPGKALVANGILKAGHIDDGSAVLVHLGNRDESGSQVFIAGCILHQKGVADAWKESQHKELEKILAGYALGGTEKRNKVTAKNLNWEERVLECTGNAGRGGTIMRTAISGDKEYFLAVSGYDGLPPKDALDNFFNSFEVSK